MENQWKDGKHNYLGTGQATPAAESLLLSSKHSSTTLCAGAAPSTTTKNSNGGFWVPIVKAWATTSDSPGSNAFVVWDWPMSVPVASVPK